MKKVWMLSSIMTILMIWLIAFYAVDHALILPSPLDVIKASMRLVTGGSSFAIMGLSLVRLILAVFISSISGLLLGVIAGLSSSVSSFMKPYITMLRTIPVISIVVILLILLGQSLTPYAITFFMVFPIMYQATEEGIRHIDSSFIDVYHLEAHDWKLALKHLYLPLIKPYIILASLQSFGLGLKVMVMAEYLAQTTRSIGQAIYLAKTNLDYATVFAWTILLIIVSLVMESMIRHYERRFATTLD